MQKLVIKNSIPKNSIQRFNKILHGIREIKNLINTENNNFVPHGNEYYSFVLNEIEKF